MKQPSKTKPFKRKIKYASGSAIGKRAIRILSCSNCNYGEPIAALTDAQKASHGFTGGVCQKCKTPSLRLYDSSAEHIYAKELEILQRAGLLTDLEYQVPFKLHAFNHATGQPKQVGKYIADFTYTDLDKNSPTYNEQVVVDVKGGNGTQIVMSKEAKAKVNHMKAEYGIDVKLVGR